MSERPRYDGDSGQASVELVAALPFLLLGLVVALQLVLVGFTAWSAGGAARAAARADYVGSDPAAAARAALPDRLATDAEVHSGTDGVEVELTVPRLLPVFPRIVLSSSTSLGPADGSAAATGAPGAGS